MLADTVTIFETGPRDGLQNEARLILAADKITLIDLLSDCGIRQIEAASFVSPKWVPQMADGADVLAGIRRRPGVVYSALTPNMQGFDRAMAAGADAVAIFASASEAFSLKNINCTIEESLKRFAPVVAAAHAEALQVRAYVSCVVECPYSGAVDPAQVADIAAKLLALGCFEISLGDTIGRGTPASIGAMLDAVVQVVPPHQLAGHYHDTGGRALDNIAVSLDRGLRVFDTAAGGLGGCPFAPGASGNVATESVVDMLHAKGFVTGIDPDRLATAARFARSLRTAT
jgi:hydroxymethylglutaryl-CoA lyase